MSVRYLVISGTGWICGQAVVSDNQEAALAISGITIEDRCASMQAANDRAVEIAKERGLV